MATAGSSWCKARRGAPGAPAAPAAPAAPDLGALERALDRRPHPDWFTVLAQAQLATPVGVGRRPVAPSSAVARALGRALHLAARHDMGAHVELLLARGAPVDAPERWDEDGGVVDGDGCGTPLLTCAEWRRGSEGAAAVLLAHGAAAGGPAGAAVLARAVRHGHHGLVRLVARAGGAGGVDARSARGWTALHEAARLGDVAAARVLVGELGADAAAATVRGESVEDVARRHERGHFIEWMYVSGALAVPAGSTAVVKRCAAAAFGDPPLP